MGEYCIVLSDGETYGQLDGCTIIYVPDVFTVEDSDSEILMMSPQVAGFAVMDDDTVRMARFHADGTDMEVTYFKLQEIDTNAD